MIFRAALFDAILIALGERTGPWRSLNTARVVSNLFLKEGRRVASSAVWAMYFRGRRWVTSWRLPSGNLSLRDGVPYTPVFDADRSRLVKVACGDCEWSDVALQIWQAHREIRTLVKVSRDALGHA